MAVPMETIDMKAIMIMNAPAHAKVVCGVDEHILFVYLEVIAVM